VACVIVHSALIERDIFFNVNEDDVVEIFMAIRKRSPEK
jgi:hypothetical protein